jgi:methionine-S-sulfoxide reductase
VAVLAGGCFWGVEEILRDVPGLIDTEVGYTGGWLENPRYADTHRSKSGHAEAVRVTFDPSVLSYDDLLEKWFFKLHDPTTLNRQGYDVGTQYRSAIFPQTPDPKTTAERVMARVESSGSARSPQPLSPLRRGIALKNITGTTFASTLMATAATTCVTKLNLRRLVCVKEL